MGVYIDDLKLMLSKLDGLNGEVSYEEFSRFNQATTGVAARAHFYRIAHSVSNGRWYDVNAVREAVKTEIESQEQKTATRDDIPEEVLWEIRAEVLRELASHVLHYDLFDSGADRILLSYSEDEAKGDSSLV